MSPGSPPETASVAPGHEPAEVVRWPRLERDRVALSIRARLCGQLLSYLLSGRGWGSKAGRRWSSCRLAAFAAASWWFANPRLLRLAGLTRPNRSAAPFAPGRFYPSASCRGRPNPHNVRLEEPAGAQTPESERGSQPVESSQFDKAAPFTGVPRPIQQINVCDNVYEFNFPVRIGNSITIYRGWRAERHHRKP